MALKPDLSPFRRTPETGAFAPDYQSVVVAVLNTKAFMLKHRQSEATSAQMTEARAQGVPAGLEATDPGIGRKTKRGIKAAAISTNVKD
jgi:hypothetical protein